MHAERLDHVGIKVASIDLALSQYTALGFRVTRRCRFPEVGAEIAFLELSGQRFELLEPLGGESSLHEAPDGLHHMALCCSDVDAAFEEMKADPRYSLTGPPITGSHGRPVLFFRAAGSNTLLELVGAPRPPAEEPEIWRW